MRQPGLDAPLPPAGRDLICYATTLPPLWLLTSWTCFSWFSSQHRFHSIVQPNPNQPRSHYCTFWAQPCWGFTCVLVAASAFSVRFAEFCFGCKATVPGFLVFTSSLRSPLVQLSCTPPQPWTAVGCVMLRPVCFSRSRMLWPQSHVARGLSCFAF